MESTAKPKFDLIMELNQPTLPTNNTPKKSLSLSTTKIATKMNKKKKNLHQHSPRTKKHLFVKKTGTNNRNK